MSQHMLCPTKLNIVRPLFVATHLVSIDSVLLGVVA